ncbi:hypothetical protein RhiirA4_462942 [Rhizophagus irregularis]|uniref:DUF659 domain-containing protein n=1 Tax=Rhizophagus irregularis TaxID=588596 RepID=A0A2I1GLY0_9GLOM|nr:hypothetical protein RhiirA4_462942 [Rhizophagus irregularis]
MLKKEKTISIYIRLNEYKKVFCIDDNILFYIYCNISVEWKHKSVVDNHCKSQKHKLNVRNLIEAFAAANIPLEKINCLLPFIKKHVKNGVAIIMDETTDDCARSVVNILFCYRHETKLVSVNFFECVNNTIMRQVLTTILTHFNISFSLPHLFLSDLAAYMKKCHREVLSPFNNASINSCAVLCTYYKSYWQSKKPVFPIVELRLQQLTAYIETYRNSNDFGFSLENLIIQLQFNTDEFYTIF